MNAVDQVLAKMIYNWPTLYVNRLAALKEVFADGAQWNKDGSVWLMALDGASEKTVEDEEAAVAEETKFYDKLADNEENRRGRATAVATARLRVRERNARYAFIRENADVLAVAAGKFDYVPRFSLHALNAIPLDRLSPAWKAALGEFAHAILCFSDRDMERCKLAHGPNVDYVSRLEEAKVTARECLLRLYPEKEAANARREEIERIRREAEKFGLTLTPIQK